MEVLRRRTGKQIAAELHISPAIVCRILPRPTYLPLCSALATAAAVLAMLFKFYLLALAVALVTAGLFVLSGQSAGLARDYGPLPVGRGLSLPPIQRWPTRRRGGR